MGMERKGKLFCLGERVINWRTLVEGRMELPQCKFGERFYESAVFHLGGRPNELKGQSQNNWSASSSL